MRRTLSARARKRDLAGSMRAPVFSWGGSGVSQASFQIPDSGGKELQRNSLEKGPRPQGGTENSSPPENRDRRVGGFGSKKLITPCWKDSNPRMDRDMPRKETLVKAAAGAAAASA
ncbi:hypothetical protein CDAR_14291 [Caerostris darwini]|uniref:Uncharacterized protein n=1 Tax=Caerostris darwini TaxID=1538125 RepID=A0AAV4QE19_9ARAC|nr:hypothetical protein CDAR_14291 [Caerostris darwini]